ncbi:MAG TPA: hypothetical protein VGJ21_22280 [Terracidiphilus sp.]|jgi:hypothetical protein
MKRWLRIAVLGLVAFAAISFIADWAVYKITGSPKSKFTVHHFVSAPLKSRGQEIDYTGSEDVPCALTMYPQDHLIPCWYLRRHTNQVSNY